MVQIGIFFFACEIFAGFFGKKRKEEDWLASEGGREMGRRTGWRLRGLGLRVSLGDARFFLLLSLSFFPFFLSSFASDYQHATIYTVTRSLIS